MHAAGKVHVEGHVRYHIGLDHFLFMHAAGKEALQSNVAEHVRYLVPYRVRLFLFRHAGGKIALQCNPLYRACSGFHYGSLCVQSGYCVRHAGSVT